MLIEESLEPIWVKQQERVDLPLKTLKFEDADGVVLSDGETYLGITGRNMRNYTPLVRVEEVSSDPYIVKKMAEMQKQIDNVYNVQTYGTVPKADLDAAYKEGVNSYAE